MSGSAGKMGDAEMKEGLKSSLLNKVKVTDKFWRGYQELVIGSVIVFAAIWILEKKYRKKVKTLNCETEKSDAES